jgi:predicted Zn finger-like uncharacterized protein
MQIICPTCNATYTIKSSKMPRKRAVAKCKQCGSRIVVEPEKKPIESILSPTVPSVDHRPTPPPATNPGEAKSMAVLEAYPDLRGLDTKQFILEEMLCPNKKGEFKTRKNRLKLKVFHAVQGVLEKVLKDDETVMRIGKGTAYYPAEIFFGNGFLTMMYNHYALVCTNQRLLFININSRMNRHTHYIFQMPYESIKKVKFGVSCSLLLYKNKGKRKVFRSVKRYLGRELKQFILEKLETIPAPSTGMAEEPLENLCPACFVPLAKDLVRCPHCQTRFKEPKKALLKSLVLPGWGDIYLGHRALGIFELVGTVFVWTVGLSLLLAGEPGALITVLLILVFYNGFDGVFTYHMAKKGYMASKA